MVIENLFHLKMNSFRCMYPLKGFFSIAYNTYICKLSVTRRHDGYFFPMFCMVDVITTTRPSTTMAYRAFCNYLSKIHIFKHGI